MHSSEQPALCPRCGAEWDRKADYCAECGAALTDAARSVQRDDARSCAFFFFLAFSLLFLLAGGAGIFLGSLTGEFSDPQLRRLTVPGYVLLVLSMLCTGVLIRIAVLNRRTWRSDVHGAQGDSDG